MDERLKHRVVGAVVLFTLLAILAPALFTGGESHPLVLEQPAVVVPVTEPLPVPKAVEQLAINPERVQVQDTQPAQPLVEPVTETVKKFVGEEIINEPKTGVDIQGHLKAWALQLGTFADKRNAEKLEKQLKADGYQAFIKAFAHSSGKTLYPVYIGPEVRSDELEQLKIELKRKLKLDGMVVRYEP